MKYLAQNIIFNEEKDRFIETVYSHQLFHGQVLCEEECATAPTDAFLPLVNELLSFYGYRSISDLEDAQWDEINQDECKKYFSK